MILLHGGGGWGGYPFKSHNQVYHQKGREVESSAREGHQLL